MSISKYDSLKNLIGGMSRSEKRHFRLYVSRLESNSGVLYLELFDLIEKNNSIEEETVRRKLSIKSSQQLSNLKRHLFNQILKSLRLIYSQNHSSLQLNENHDYAYILKSKSLYQESLHYINKCHNVLDNTNKAMEIQLLTDRINLNTYIHQYDSQKDSSQEKHLRTLFTRIEKIKNNQILNIAIEKIKDEFSYYSFSKHSRENYLKRSLLNAQLANMEKDFLSTEEQFLHELIWAMHYHYCVQNNIAYHYLLKAKMHLEKIEKLSYMEKIHDFYLTGLSITCHYKDSTRHNEWLDNYEEYLSTIDNTEDRHQVIYFFKYFLMSRLDGMILNHDYTRFSEIETSLKEYQVSYNRFIPGIDIDRLNYKLACIYAYKGDYDKALDHLSVILNTISRSPKEKELQLYARMLHVQCHYRLNNFQYVENNIGKLRMEFVNNNAYNKIIDTLLVFLRRGTKAMNFGLKDFINELTDKLESIEAQDFDRISSYYFDHIAWLKSIKTDISVESYNLKSENIN